MRQLDRTSVSLIMTGLVLCLVLAVMAATVSDSTSSQVTNKHQVNDIRPTIVKLSRCRKFENFTVGEGAASSSCYALYRQLSDERSTLSRREWTWLRENGSPAARVYAAVVACKQDSEVGKEAFVELLEDSSKVEYQSGCEVFATSLKSIAQEFIATGKFLDFEDNIGTTTGGTPLYVRELCRAKVFADHIGSESGQYREFLIFQSALMHVKALHPDDLRHTLSRGSPAGRLYAALLLRASGGSGNGDPLSDLLEDKSPVTYASGCKHSLRTVSEIAAQLKETGRFHNFSMP